MSAHHHLPFRQRATAGAARLAMAASLLALTIAAAPAHAQGATASPVTAQDAQRNWSIPAGDLNAVIHRLAQEAGIYVTGAGVLTEGKQSRGVQGSLTVAQALQAALAGTGLEATHQGAGTYALKPGDAQVVRASGTAAGNALPEVVVVAAPSSATPSEGQDTYATRASGTSTKLDLSLRHTPQSITVLTRQRLDDIGAQNLHEVMAEVPGIVVSITDTERVSYMSRGYNISTYQIDGVNHSYTNGYTRLASDPVLYDRIEVLRGSAGHTVGAGDPSGTINQVRKLPTREFSGSAGLTLGRWNNRRGEIDLSGPIAFDGKIRGRVVAAKQKSDSFRDWYTTDKNVFYGVLQADVGDRTTVTAGYTLQDPDNAGVTWGTIPYWLSDGSLANMPRSFNPAARWSRWNIKEKQAFARVEHQFNDNWSARLNFTDDDQDGYGHRWFGGNGYFPNPDGTGKSAWDGGSDHYGNLKTWDLDVNGRFALLGREHQVNFGYHNQKTSQRSLASERINPDGYFTTIPDWRNWDGIVPEYTVNYLGYDSSRTEVEQSAFYVASKLSLTDRFNVIAGTRLTDWSQDAYTRDNTTGLYSRTGYEHDNVWTPYLAAMYDLNQHLTAYASYTDIFAAQNYRDANGNFIDPVNGTTYELGLKGEFFDGDLNAALAIYRSKKDNVAEIDDAGALTEGSFDPANPPEGYSSAGYRFIPGTEELAYRNTGKGNRMQGIELEVQGAVNRNWNLAVGFSHAQMQNKDGESINFYLPRNSLRLRTTYRLPGALSKLTVGGGATWQSVTWAAVNNVPTGQTGADGRAITESRRIVQEAFWLLNLSARYQFSDNLSASLNINNALDKSYFNRVGFYSGVTYGAPRDWRLSVRYTF